MRSAVRHHLSPVFCLLVAVLLSGCAAPGSMIVLLPKDGKVSGEVVVTNAHGSQVLNQSWQSVRIADPADRPATPVLLDQPTVREVFAKVLSAMPAAPVHYLLYFKLGSDQLLPDSERLLPAIAKVIRERQPAQLSVVGHTDTIGSGQYNHQLGSLRATAIPRLLSALGAVPTSLETSSRGKSDLAVKTADQTPEPRNRRAEVTVR